MSLTKHLPDFPQNIFEPGPKMKAFGLIMMKISGENDYKKTKISTIAWVSLNCFMAFSGTLRPDFIKLSNLLKFKSSGFTTAPSKDLFEVLEEKIEEDIGYDQWLSKTKLSLSTSKGRFWLGKSAPFPFNSSFMPRSILSNSSKIKIFEFFKKNPNINDHRLLAQKFKVSIERVKAIIKQKELELELANQGKIVDKEFVSALESNLECVEISDENIEFREHDKKLPFRPLFSCIQEGSPFTFEDAKKALTSTGINIIAPSLETNINSDRINIRNVRIPTTISKSEFETSRSKFIFVNIKKKGPQNGCNVLVRDCDGTLREATFKESEYASGKTWNRNRPKEFDDSPLHEIYMARRYHTSSTDEFTNSEYKIDASQLNSYVNYNNNHVFQENYEYESDSNCNNEVSCQARKVDNTYDSTRVGVPISANYGYESAMDINNQRFEISNLNIGIPQVNFPMIHTSSAVQHSGSSAYGSQYKYESNGGKSWLSAFSSGGFDNEPSLLEELGINFNHIKNKTLASLNPFRKLDAGTLNDADLTGPLLFCFLFGTLLLLSGKIHFGYIYGVATLGWISIFTILNLMTEAGVSFYLIASVLGYCLLPMVLLSAFAVLLKLRGIVGLILGVSSVSWCTFSSSTYFVAAFGMNNQQILIAYPIFLLYSCFALMTIF